MSLVLQEAAMQQNKSLNALNNFTANLQQNYKNKVVQEATDKALKDSLNGEPYHREETYTVYQKAYQNTRDGTYSAKLELQIKNQSDAFAEQYKTDPDAYRNAMSNYLDETVEESTKLDPKFGIISKISGTKIMNHQTGKIDIVKSKLVNDDKLDTYTQFIDGNISRAINMKTTGNTRDYDLLEESLLDYTNAMVSDGVLKPQQAHKILDRVKHNVEKGSQEQIMKDLIEEGNVDKARSMIRPIEDGESWESYNSIQSSLNTILNQGLRKQAAEHKGMIKANNTSKKEALNEITKGNIPVDLAEIIAKEGDPQLNKKIQTQVQVQKIMQPFGDQSLVEQQYTFNILSASDSNNPEIKQEVGKALKARLSKAKKDPVALAQEEGMIDLNVLDITNGNFKEDLAARFENLPLMEETYGAFADKVFTNSEQESISTYLEDINTPIEDKMLLIRQISMNEGSGKAFAQLSKNAPVMSMVGSLIDSKAAVANKILKGQMILKEIPNLIDFQMLNSSISMELGNLLQYQSGGSRNAVYKSAAALYATNSEATGKLDNNFENIDETIEELLGGISERNDQKFFLPTNMDEDEFEDYIDDLTVEDIPEARGLSPENTLDVITTGQLISVGKNKYAIRKNGKWLDGLHGRYILELGN